jgi:endogenous inhibitor of DNA gyrase (YacG/DUF329 family)
MEDPPTAFNPCGICGRTFHPDVLERHERICSKNAVSSAKRKVFDTKKHRIMGTELQNFQTPPKSTKEDESKKLKATKSSWKQKHEQFIESIRSARTVSKAIAKGDPLPEYTPSAPNPDYVQCPYCERRFQQDTAERHIPFCKEKSQRVKMKANSAGKDNLSKRTQYKPPSLKKKSAGTPKAPLPGSSVVMKQSNFADTYTVNAVDGGVAGGPPTNIRGGSVRGNVVVGQPPRGKKTVASDTRVRKAVHEGTKQHTSTPNTHSTSSRRTAKTTSSNYERFSGDADYDRMDNDIETDSLDSYSRDYVMEKPKRKTVMRQKRLEQSSDFDETPALGSSRQPVVKNLPQSRQQNGYHQPSPSNDPWSRVSSSSSGGRGPALSEHGMPMSRYCYECGSKYPVPQAKYCCMCGIRRL